MARFSKVSFDQFMKDWCDTFNIVSTDPNVRKDIESIYGGIELPTRATAGSAGYDFCSPLTFSLEPGETIKIPTARSLKLRPRKESLSTASAQETRW